MAKVTYAKLAATIALRDGTVHSHIPHPGTADRWDIQLDGNVLRVNYDGQHGVETMVVPTSNLVFARVETPAPPTGAKAK